MLKPLRGYRESEEFGFDLRDCIYLGEGHNGIVYLMPDGRVIKIFKEKKNCKDEYVILKSASQSRFFPKVYSMGDNYIIREYVSGKCAKDYIKENGLTEKLAQSIMELLDEFEKLKFTKLDIRCRDLFVQDDESVKVIDPKACYKRKMDFPRHLAKGLKKLGVLDDFLNIVKEKRPKLYEVWVKKIKNAKIIKES